MNWYGSGFIILLNYGIFGLAPIQEISLITETTDLDIMTENSEDLLTES